MTARSWCYTSFADSLPVMTTHMHFRYCIHGQETCPDTGRLHWQGYAEFKSPLRYTQVQQIIGDCAMHCEKRRGTREQARDYCRKTPGGLVIEEGEWDSGGQGKRTDLDDLKEDIKAGAELSDLFENHPTAWRLTKSMDRYRSLIMAKNKRPFQQKKVIILEGPPGCGKSKWVDDNYPSHYVKKKGKWFDGYNEERCIFIDEFDPKDYTIQDLNMLCDGRDYLWEIKGGSVLVRADCVIFGTNVRSDLWYKDIADDVRNSLFRRVTHIENFWPHRNLEVLQIPKVTEAQGGGVILAPPLVKTEQNYWNKIPKYEKIKQNKEYELASQDLKEQLGRAEALQVKDSP